MEYTNIKSTEKCHHKHASYPHSGHDPKVLRGIFTGFLHRAYTFCEGQRREEEVDFIVFLKTHMVNSTIL